MTTKDFNRFAASMEDSPLRIHTGLGDSFEELQIQLRSGSLQITKDLLAQRQRAHAQMNAVSGTTSVLRGLGSIFGL